jgi:hypothetical protein
MKKATEYTKFQLFVLIYLYARQLEEGTLLESAFDKRIKMRIKEFANLAPTEILPNNDIEIRQELDTLRRDLLITDTGDYYFLTNTDGVIFVRKHLYSLASKMLESQEDESIIDKIQAKKEVKNYFKDLWSKTKEKSQEQISDSLVSGAKQFGPIAITFLGQLFLI